MIQAKVVGSAALSAKFRLLEQAVQERVITGALAAGALKVANQAKVNAPWVTGTLRRSIHVGGHTSLTPDFKGEDLGEGKGLSVMVGTQVPYGRRVEFGFTGQDSLGRTYDQAGKPYLTPALEQKREEALKEMGEAFGDIVRRLA